MPQDEREHSEHNSAAEKLVGADRVIAVLAELATHSRGVTLDELATHLRSSKPTVHRALATLRRAGFADQSERGVYLLGDEYLRLAFQNLEGRPETARIGPLLEELAQTYGETAHYAVLSGTDIVYRAKMDPPQGAVRLNSVIGGRNPAYRTAVGKALLSGDVATLEQVEKTFGPFPLEAKTPATHTTAEGLLAELQGTRARGYGIDAQENEIGVNCVAIPVFLDGASEATGAISISAVTFRTPLAQLIDAIPEIRATIARRLGVSSIR